jgi:hypothetical protein
VKCLIPEETGISPSPSCQTCRRRRRSLWLKIRQCPNPNRHHNLNPLRTTITIKNKIKIRTAPKIRNPGLSTSPSPVKTRAPAFTAGIVGAGTRGGGSRAGSQS